MLLGEKEWDMLWVKIVAFLLFAVIWIVPHNVASSRFLYVDTEDKLTDLTTPGFIQHNDVIVIASGFFFEWTSTGPFSILIRSNNVSIYGETFQGMSPLEAPRYNEDGSFHPDEVILKNIQFSIGTSGVPVSNVTIDGLTMVDTRITTSQREYTDGADVIANVILKVSNTNPSGGSDILLSLQPSNIAVSGYNIHIKNMYIPREGSIFISNDNQDKSIRTVVENIISGTQIEQCQLSTTHKRQFLLQFGNLDSEIRNVSVFCNQVPIRFREVSRSVVIADVALDMFSTGIQFRGQQPSSIFTDNVVLSKFKTAGVVIFPRVNTDTVVIPPIRLRLNITMDIDTTNTNDDTQIQNTRACIVVDHRGADGTHSPALDIVVNGTQCILEGDGAPGAGVDWFHGMLVYGGTNARNITIRDAAFRVDPGVGALPYSSAVERVYTGPTATATEDALRRVEIVNTAFEGFQDGGVVFPLVGPPAGGNITIHIDNTALRLPATASGGAAYGALVLNSTRQTTGGWDVRAHAAPLTGSAFWGHASGPQSADGGYSGQGGLIDNRLCVHWWQTEPWRLDTLSPPIVCPHSNIPPPPQPAPPPPPVPDEGFDVWFDTDEPMAGVPVFMGCGAPAGTMLVLQPENTMVMCNSTWTIPLGRGSTLVRLETTNGVVVFEENMFDAFVHIATPVEEQVWNATHTVHITCNRTGPLVLTLHESSVGAYTLPVGTTMVHTCPQDVVTQVPPDATARSSYMLHAAFVDAPMIVDVRGPVRIAPRIRGGGGDGTDDGNGNVKPAPSPTPPEHKDPAPTRDKDVHIIFRGPNWLLWIFIIFAVQIPLFFGVWWCVYLRRQHHTDPDKGMSMILV